MFNIEMLPAAQGDCFWIEYGDSADPKRILIDGGVVGTYKILKKRILELPDPRFELIVVTHVDRDHIEGILRMLNDPAVNLDVGDFWFNGYPHIANPHESVHDKDQNDPDDVLGPEQGDFLGALIAIERNLKNKWNRSFEGKAVMTADDELPTKEFDGGLKVTLLSPSQDALRNFKPVWERELKGKFTPGDFEAALESLSDRRDLQPADDLLGTAPSINDLVNRGSDADTSKANGSSIAMLVSYDGKTCLFGADAYSLVLETAVERLLAPSGDLKLSIDAFKIPHHGGKKNLKSSLLQRLDCERFLISTNGSYYDHPDPETIARIIRFSNDPKLMFNYRSEENLVWDDELLKRGRQGKDRYRTVYPEEGKDGLVVSLG